MSKEQPPNYPETPAEASCVRAESALPAIRVQTLAEIIEGREGHVLTAEDIPERPW